MPPTKREKPVAPIDSLTPSDVRDPAKAEGPPHAPVERRAPEEPRARVVAAYHASHETFADLYRRLAR